MPVQIDTKSCRLTSFTLNGVRIDSISSKCKFFHFGDKRGWNLVHCPTCEHTLALLMTRVFNSYSRLSFQSAININLINSNRKTVSFIWFCVRHKANKYDFYSWWDARVCEWDCINIHNDNDNNINKIYICINTEKPNAHSYLGCFAFRESVMNGIKTERKFMVF